MVHSSRLMLQRSQARHALPCCLLLEIFVLKVFRPSQLAKRIWRPFVGAERNRYGLAAASRNFMACSGCLRATYSSPRSCLAFFSHGLERSGFLHKML